MLQFLTHVRTSVKGFNTWTFLGRNLWKKLMTYKNWHNFLMVLVIGKLEIDTTFEEGEIPAKVI